MYNQVVGHISEQSELLEPSSSPQQNFQATPTAEGHASAAYDHLQSKLKTSLAVRSLLVHATTENARS